MDTENAPVNSTVLVEPVLPVNVTDQVDNVGVDNVAGLSLLEL